MVRIRITDRSQGVKAAAQERDGDSPAPQDAAATTPTGARPRAVGGDDETDPTAQAARAAAHGADMTAGDITAPQDAAAAADEQQAQRTGEADMRRRQEAGEVDTQTKDSKPHSAHPEAGLPDHPTGGENTGAGTPAGASASASGGASDGTVARAAAEHDERFLRLAADFENFKRQATRREGEIREHTTMRVVEDILPVLDNFELAIKSAQAARDIEQVRVGVEYILQQLRTVLKNHGVEPLEAKGKSFDPLQHDALEEVADSGHPEGTVVDETQRGYSFKGRVLRPSRVRVAGGKK